MTAVLSPSRLASLLDDDDLPMAELCAARLDGELFGIGEGFAPVDMAETTLLRALSVARLTRGRLIAERATAAWILGATPTVPDRHQFCAPLSARSRPAYPARVTVREVVIGPADCTEIGGVQVTTELRTILDLVRFSEPFDERAAAMVSALADLGGLDRAHIRQVALGRRNLPNKRLALRRLAFALGA